MEERAKLIITQTSSINSGSKLSVVVEFVLSALKARNLIRKFVSLSKHISY